MYLISQIAEANEVNESSRITFKPLVTRNDQNYCNDCYEFGIHLLKFRMTRVTVNWFNFIEHSMTGEKEASPIFNELQLHTLDSSV